MTNVKCQVNDSMSDARCASIVSSGCRRLHTALLGLAFLSALCLRCEGPRPTTVRAILENRTAYAGKRVALRGRAEWSQSGRSFALTDSTGRIAVITRRRSLDNRISGDTVAITGDVRVSVSARQVSIEEYLPWSYFFLRESRDVLEVLAAQAGDLKSGLEGWLSGLVNGRAPSDSLSRPPRMPVPIAADSEPRFEYFSDCSGIIWTWDNLTITSAGKTIHATNFAVPGSPEGDTWTISAARVTELTNLFNKVNFMHLRPPKFKPYEGAEGGPGLSVTYRYHGMMNTYDVGRGAESFSARVRPIRPCIKALMGVLAEHERAIDVEKEE